MVKDYIKSTVEKYPQFFIASARLYNNWHRHRPDYTILNSQSDIVIEGFPRSANSFAVHALQFAQPQGWASVATHLHSYAQVVEGIRRGIPCVVLIRKPKDAIVGFRVWAYERYIINNMKGYKKVYTMPLKNIFEKYNTFYKKLIPRASGYYLATFEHVIKDFGAVIDGLNKKFNTDFHRFNHTQENVENIFGSAPSHLSPSKEREKVKPYFVNEYYSYEFKEYRKKAEDIYREILQAKGLLA